jgi:hypothetical protein
MEKRFMTTLVIPVTLRVIADDSSGEVEITKIIGSELPTLSDVMDALAEDNLDALDADFAAA